MKPLNTALTDDMEWHRMKRSNGQLVRVIDYYLHIQLVSDRRICYRGQGE